MDHQCEQTEVIAVLRDNVEEIKKDIKAVLDSLQGNDKMGLKNIFFCTRGSEKEQGGM